jgi:hypothetical protein
MVWLLTKFAQKRQLGFEGQIEGFKSVRLNKHPIENQALKLEVR